jgi:transcriptional regulator with XRE-family HTH domain
MTEFQKNFEFLYLQSQAFSDDHFGQMLSLGRTTVNRLRNGTRQPSSKQLNQIAKYCGMETTDLLLENNAFIKIYEGKRINSGYMIHSLRTVQENLSHCKEVFEKYGGQWQVYTNCSTDGIVICSLLSILRATKNGIEFEMINPYLEDESYDAYTYKGYLIPIQDYLYFIGEQKENSYEVLTMLFHTSGAPKPTLVTGLWTGVGVKDGVKCIASVSAVAQKRKQPIEDWREHLGLDLGYVQANKLSKLVQTKLSSEVLKVYG